MSYAGGAALTPLNTAGFDGGALTKGETDGSSYPMCGLRDTHTVGGYLAPDTSSPIFLLNGVIHIPSVFVSHHGKAIDEKIPLLRINDAMSEHGCRLLDQLGYNTAASGGLKANIALEQEIFLVDREEYFRRPDLQFTGRTIMGKLPAHDASPRSCRRSPLPASTALGEQLVPLHRGHPMSYAVSAALMPSNTAGPPGAP